MENEFLKWTHSARGKWDKMTSGHFIYILESSNSSSFTCLALEATETVFELVTEMAVELINNHLISIQQKR